MYKPSIQQLVDRELEAMNDKFRYMSSNLEFYPSKPDLEDIRYNFGELINTVVANGYYD